MTATNNPDPSEEELTAAQFLQGLLSEGELLFNRGDFKGAIRKWGVALESFVQHQFDPELRPIYQKIWLAKAMAHQELKEYAKLQEAAMIANALLESPTPKAGEDKVET
jgi:tetratricopeptide (TPR) repeat protein